MLTSIAFANPLILWALLALPVLWPLLRAIPPAPIKRRFPGVALLLGLTDEERQADKTPWWLLALRGLAIGAAILGFAGPILNPNPVKPGVGPLLIALDGGWADARDWPARHEKATALLAEAARLGRTVALVQWADTPQPVLFQGADGAAGRLAAMQPLAWQPDLTAWEQALPQGPFETYWLTSGLEMPGREALLSTLASRGEVVIYTSPRPIFGLQPASFADGAVVVKGVRVASATAADLEVIARGPDPSGIDRELARGVLGFSPGAAQAEVKMTLPPELRNRITRFELLGQRSAAAVSLTDDSLRRRKIALIGGAAQREGLQLLSPTHYLQQALAPVAELIDGSLTDVLQAKPDVIVLADVAKLTQTETDGILDWLEQGGVLLRFAGPKLAASDLARDQEDALMPVRLRQGGRSVGGAMSWGEPKALAAFPESSPFYGLRVPDDVLVEQQVLAQPDPDLANRVIASLIDGTPLVTRKAVGQGQVVLFHVTANAEWSNLPLSGLFVQMLERLSVSSGLSPDKAAEVAGQVWQAETILDGYGQQADAGTVAGVQGEDFGRALADGPSAKLPPGVYAGGERRIALNVLTPDSVLTAAVWPSGTRVEGIDAVQEQSLKGGVLTAALALLAVDVLAALWVSGRLFSTAAAMIATIILVWTPAPSDAQTPEDIRAIEATRGVVLAHVLTGNAELDRVAQAGLVGLGDQLWARTSIEPEQPMGVDLETDALEFFPFLYWPISVDQPLPSTEAYAKLNSFLRSGGMIMFDTRDGDVAGLGGATAEGARLQALAAGLDIPALEVIPKDHVLTRSFYLLQDFPGRFNVPGLWVEASAPDAALEEGMPFRKLNDGVTPVIIGGNDWASAWAVDPDGVQMFPIGRGYAGEKQREIAFRFGINVIMHVLTGNYKSDQVHVPALLERLGE